jgi:hypothetical protein
MRSILIGGMLAAMLVPAFAQSNPPVTTTTPGAQITTTSPVNAANTWRSSKVIGRSVYNDQNEKLGDIEEVLLDPSGKVAGVVIGVGGFLGMGEHAVMIDFSKLKFVDEPVRSSMTTSTSTTGETTRPATATSASSRNWYPDHAVLSGVTKDQLKAMTQFKYN